MGGTLKPPLVRPRLCRALSPEFPAGARAVFYPLARGTDNPTGARDGTRADGACDRRRRRRFCFSLFPRRRRRATGSSGERPVSTTGVDVSAINSVRFISGRSPQNLQRTRPQGLTADRSTHAVGDAGHRAHRRCRRRSDTLTASAQSRSPTVPGPPTRDKDRDLGRRNPRADTRRRPPRANRSTACDHYDPIARRCRHRPPLNVKQKSSSARARGPRAQLRLARALNFFFFFFFFFF